MFRRLPALSLLLAWLCASGAMLDVAQVFAWTRMFAGYVRSDSIAVAARETFDPEKPCEICRAVSRAREAQGQHGTAVPSAAAERIVLILDSSAAFVADAAERGWPESPPARAQVRVADVPVPPPRSRVA